MGRQFSGYELIFLICKNMAFDPQGGHWGLDNKMVVKSITVMELLHHLCLDITRKGEPITLKAGGSFFETLSHFPLNDPKSPCL